MVALRTCNLTKAIERRDAGVVTSHSLVIDDADARPQADQRLNDQREAMGQFVAGRL